MNKPVIIVGAGRMGRFVAQIAIACKRQVSGFLDDTMIVGCFVDNIPVLGGVDYLEKLDGETTELVIALSHREVRQRLAIKAKSYCIDLATLVHPLAMVSEKCSLGQGVVCQAFSVIHIGATVSRNVLLEEHCSIGVDVEVGENCVLTPKATLNGASKIGPNCFIGSGAIVNPEVHIAGECTIGAGAVVINSLTTSGTYAGIPAKKLQENFVSRNKENVTLADET